MLLDSNMDVLGVYDSSLDHVHHQKTGMNQENVCAPLNQSVPAMRKEDRSEKSKETYGFV
jgi:hypothetical protein